MHRIDHPTRAADLHGAGKDGYTEGSPGVTAATVVTADAANALQEEIANAIEDRGITLVKADNTQLSAAIDAQTAPLEALVRDDLATSRGAFVHASQAKAAWDAVAGQPHWELDSSAATAHDVMRAHSNTALLQFAFMPGGNLPHQCTITAVRVYVKPSAPRTGNNRVSMRYTTLPDLIPSESAAFYDDGGTGLQAISATGLSIPLVATDSLVYPPGASLGLLVTVRAGVGTAPLNDEAYLAEVRYTLGII